jgi:ATP-dependent 26S proteasome regulatory subunit
MKKSKSQNLLVCNLIKEHFGTFVTHELVTSTRVFPATARLDLQAALAETLSGPLAPRKHVGVHRQYAHETLTFSELLVDADHAPMVAPLQYDEIDIGETMPVRCLKNAVWLGNDNDLPFALLLTRTKKYGESTGLHLELAVPPGEAGLALQKRIMTDLEKKVLHAGSYRGKVLSLELSDNYRGAVAGIKVHRLRTVRREEVILPEKTLQLLERNVTRFVQQRTHLDSMRLGVKKGLLFYGPPGTGKTHTIHYLASQLKDHTTLLVTADQVALLDEYMQLARFLQPAMVVIEDVDLIARDRNRMHGPCEESLLNRLLNEMDGLREDALVLFILTTNRPAELEEALTSRPGRIDQAIEFPRPDDNGRRQLIKLYAGGLAFGTELEEVIVRKTKGASGAFIKELMRRSAQFLLETGAENLSEGHIESALDEMLFSGGELNSKLLGMERSSE